MEQSEMMMLGLLLMSTTMIRAKGCTPGNRIFHPADCSKYLECDSVTGEETIETCPDEKLFSQILGKCINSDGDSCITQRGTCEFEDLKPNPLDCYSFLQCANGFIYILPCPAGLMFSFEMQRCEFVESVDCPTTSTTTKSTTTTQNDYTTDSHPLSTRTESPTTESTTKIVTTPPSPCQDVGTMPNPGDPTGESYLECNADPACPLHHDVVHCPEGKIYDPHTGGCWYNCTNVLAAKVYDVCGHVFCPTPAACHGDKKWVVEGPNNCWFFKQCLHIPTLGETSHLSSWNLFDRIDENKWLLCEFECPRVNNVRWVFNPREKSCQDPPISDVCPQWLFITGA